MWPSTTPSTRSSLGRALRLRWPAREKGPQRRLPSPRLRETCSIAAPTDPFPLWCTSAGVATVEADYAVALSAIPNGGARTRGEEVGREAAEAVLALADGDGSNTRLQESTTGRAPSPACTASRQGSSSLSHRAGAMRLPSCSTTAASSVPALRTGDRTELRRRSHRGQASGGEQRRHASARTARRPRSTASRWRARRCNRSLHESGVLFPRLNRWRTRGVRGLDLRIADGYVASFDTECRSDYWRPVTAIQNADPDGNQRTSGDSDSNPLPPTPPIPDYDAAHAVEGGTASQVLKRFFGTGTDPTCA